jgi:hypothetical protein
MKFHPIRRAVEKLGPSASLCVLAVPLLVVEPLKLVALFIAGSGHWITGTVTIACAYAVSLLVIERLFVIVKPKLLTLHWFASLWNGFVAARGVVLGWFGLKSPRGQLAKQPIPSRVTHRVSRR